MYSKFKISKITPQGILEVRHAFQLKLKAERKWKLKTGF
jgi:hypothetical protein